MPLALDPFETFEISLLSDKDKPEADRPMFRFRYLSLREWRKNAPLSEISDVEEISSPKAVGEVLIAIRENLLDWRVNDPSGQPIPYNTEELDRILTLWEVWELFHLSRRQSKLSVTEKNELESPSPTSTEPSAETADPETATTDPQ